MDQGLYGFPKTRQHRPRPHKFTRYFDAMQFGSPVLWWAVDSVVYNNARQVIGFYDKSGSNRVALGPAVDLESTAYGPAVYVTNRVYTFSANPVTGSNPRTILLVFVGNHSTSGLNLRPIWRHGGFHVSHISSGYVVQPSNPISSLNPSPILSLGQIFNLAVVGLRYDGSTLYGYVNGEMGATNTVTLNTSSGSVDVLSHNPSTYVLPSSFWFYECVLYDVDIGDSLIRRASYSLLRQYMSML